MQAILMDMARSWDRLAVEAGQYTASQPVWTIKPESSSPEA
jgi:hypothetical protein